MPRVRTAVIRTLVTDSNTDIELPGEDARFALPPVGHLVFASVFLSTAAQGPVFASIHFEASDEPNERQQIADSKWIRGNAVFGQQNASRFIGSLPLGINDHILFAIRNDTGATVRWQGTWVTDV